MFPLDGNISHPLSRKLKTNTAVYANPYNYSMLMITVKIIFPSFKCTLLLLTYWQARVKIKAVTSLPHVALPPSLSDRSDGLEELCQKILLLPAAFVLVLLVQLPREIVFIPSGRFFQSQVRFRPRLLLPAVSDESVIMCGAGVGGLKLILDKWTVWMG